MKYVLNTITVSLENYRHYWRGIPKIGKTTLFRDLIIKNYGSPEYGLLISPGNETGYRALSNLYAVEAPDWRAFLDIVDDLVDNKSENKFRLLAIDTVDELVSIASDETLRVHYKRKGEKAESLNAALGGYGSAHKYVCDLINDQIRRLEGAGYGLVFISHTKIKDIKEKNMEESYQQLTTGLESRFDKIFSDKADIIATLYLEKNVKDNALLGTQRYIYFRNDGFVDAGSRFKEMPERVPMTAEDYLKAFEKGVRSSFAEPVSSKEIEELHKKEIEEKDTRAAEFIENSRNSDKELQTVEYWHNAITEAISAIGNKETKKAKRAEIKAAGLPDDYKTIEDVEKLKEFLDIIKK